VRRRPVDSLVLLLAVGVLSLLVGLIVFGVLLVGLMPTVGMSAAVLGGDGLGQMLGSMWQRGEFGTADGSVALGGAGHAVAAGIGAGLLWALAGSLVSLVNLMGLNLAYLRLTSAPDTGAVDITLDSPLGAPASPAGDPTTAAGRPLRTSMAGVAMPQRSVPRDPPDDATMPSMKKVRAACTQCLSAIVPDQVYCSVCGHRLK